MIPNAKAKILNLLQSRHGRRKSDHFVCEGTRCCAEAARHRPEWVEFGLRTPGLPTPEAIGWPMYEVDEAEFARHAQTENPQGILLVMRRPEPDEGAVSDPFVLVLDRLQTPGNLGTILRTALAVGLRSIAYTRGTVDPYGPKSIRAGMGAQFRLDMKPFDDLAAARDWYAGRGYPRLWLTVPHGGVDCFSDEFEPAGSLLVMGNEANGVEELPGASRVTIPMAQDVESLNVAQAATLLMYQHIARRSRGLA